MRRLRTLAGLACVAGVFAGLTSCANKKGDLGADLDTPPVVANGGAGRSVLDITSPADIPTGEAVDLSRIDPAAKPVSANREATIAALAKSDAAKAAEGAAKAIADVKLAPKGDTVDIPKADTKPEAKKEIAVPAPIAPAIAPAIEGAAAAIANVKLEPVILPAVAPAFEGAAKAIADVKIIPVVIPEVAPALEGAAKAIADVKLVPVVTPDVAPALEGAASAIASVKIIPVVAPEAAPVLAGAAKAIADVKIATPRNDTFVVPPSGGKTVASEPVPSKGGTTNVEEKAKVANELLSKEAESGVRWTPIKADAGKTAVAPADSATPNANSNVALVADDDNKNPPPPPKPETPEEKRLREAAKLQSIEMQAKRAEAEQAYQTGLRLFNDWEYEKAKQYFVRALQLDPLHEGAQEKLRTVNALLNIDVNPIAAIARQMVNEEKVKMQEQTILLSHLLDEAQTFENRGTEESLATDPEHRIRSLGEQLINLETAQGRYERVLTIINYMPPSAEWPSMRKRVQEALTRVAGKIQKVNEAISFNNRTIAMQQNELVRTRQTELYRIRINKMLEAVKALYDMQQYHDAEQMAMRVLIADPLNAAAESWKRKARSAYHSKEKIDFRADFAEEYRQSMLDVDEASIATAPLIQYPPNWDQISKRSDTAIGKKISEEPWKADIRKKLQRKVSFEFVDTPLADAVEFLRHLANVTMIIDPKVLAAQPPQINLRVTDMNLDLALEWILKLAELEYALQDNAIFISKPQTLLPQVEMRIYDVSDLTQSIQDFPGPEFQITVAGDKGAAPGAGGAGPFGGGAPKTTPPTNATIQEMIKTRIRPDTWDPAQGTSIEEKGGKLVVTQRPEVHKLIDQLLSNFRSTQKMMINIESRFLNIREAYLEETGVEFQGLDPNVLTGDFGDLRRLGAPTGFIQPRVPGSGESSPGNIPFPGFVNGPDTVNGGALSEVGSIVNHFINFFPNDPDTISAQDTTNTVRQGGLSAQVTILNNAQMQAFIRALAVRENSSTLVAPRLTVFNTQRANMFVARQQSYVADYEISGDSYDPVIRQFLVGVVLDVKPIVSSDRRYVTLELRPTVTDLVNFVTRQIDAFTINNGANVAIIIMLSFPIQFPELAIRRVRTTATVPDGGIMLVGGLYKNLKFNAENGVPFLSDLPVIGRLFRWNTVDNVKTNLAILISPRIILFNEEEEKLLDNPAPGPMYPIERKEESKEKVKCK